MTCRALLFALALGLSGTARGAILDSLVARIDQEVITWSQVLQEVEIRRLTGESESLTGPPLVRRALVKRRLLIVEAEKLRIEVSDAEVGEAMTSLSAASEKQEFWERVAAIGIGRRELEVRARELILERRYLDLRREMTFVPESEIRSFYAEHQEALGGRPLAEVRDEVRAYLAQREYQEELDAWIDRQVQEGRVMLFPLRVEE